MIRWEAFEKCTRHQGIFFCRLYTFDEISLFKTFLDGGCIAGNGPRFFRRGEYCHRADVAAKFGEPASPQPAQDSSDVHEATTRTAESAVAKAMCEIDIQGCDSVLKRG